MYILNERPKKLWKAKGLTPSPCNIFVWLYNILNYHNLQIKKGFKIVSKETNPIPWPTALTFVIKQKQYTLKQITQYSSLNSKFLKHVVVLKQKGGGDWNEKLHVQEKKSKPVINSWERIWWNIWHPAAAGVKTGYKKGRYFQKLSWFLRWRAFGWYSFLQILSSFISGQKRVCDMQLDVSYQDILS